MERRHVSFLVAALCLYAIADVEGQTTDMMSANPTMMMVVSGNTGTAVSNGPTDSATKSFEDQQRELVLAIADTLSSAQCTEFVKLQASSESITLDVACQTLVQFHSLVALIGCTEDDYQKLQPVVCNLGQPLAATTGSAPVMADDTTMPDTTDVVTMG